MVHPSWTGCCMPLHDRRRFDWGQCDISPSECPIVFWLLRYAMETVFIWMRYRKILQLGKHLVHWTSAVFSIFARKINTVYIFSHDGVTHDLTVILHLQLQLKCDMGWYRYTYPSEQSVINCTDSILINPCTCFLIWHISIFKKQ